MSAWNLAENMLIRASSVGQEVDHMTIVTPTAGAEPFSIFQPHQTVTHLTFTTEQLLLIHNNGVSSCSCCRKIKHDRSTSSWVLPVWKPRHLSCRPAEQGAPASCSSRSFYVLYRDRTPSRAAAWRRSGPAGTGWPQSGAAACTLRNRDEDRKETLMSLLWLQKCFTQTGTVHFLLPQSCFR